LFGKREKKYGKKSKEDTQIGKQKRNRKSKERKNTQKKRNYAN